MILFADSGSTKTEWILTEENQIIYKCESIGLNPFFVNATQINQAIVASGLLKYNKEIKELHFYGAGCSVSEKCTFLKKEMAKLFVNATVQIYTDIEGAVLATTHGKPGIVCILGTGSTFRIFDGNEIVRKYSSLSYIIGDEGSGTHISKALLRGVFYQNLSNEIQDDFFKDFPISANDILENVYNKPLPNRYLASFVPFCKKHIEKSEIKALVKNSFHEFVNQHLLKYAESKQYPLHFVGSVAFHFQEQLMEVLKENNMQSGVIIQKPLEQLVLNHFAS